MLIQQLGKVRRSDGKWNDSMHVSDGQFIMATREENAMGSNLREGLDLCCPSH